MRATAAALAAIARRRRRHRARRARRDRSRASRRARPRPASAVDGRHCPLQTRRMQRIEADAIDQLGRPLDVPDREVAPTCRLRACRSRREPPSARAASRVTPARHSSTVRRNSVAAMFMVSSSEVSGEVPGLQSVASAIGTPCRRNSVDRRRLRLAQEVEGAGQQHRDRAGLAPSRRRRPRRYIRDDRPTARRSSAASARAVAGWRAGRHAASPAGRRLAPPRTRARSRSGEKAMPSQKASTASARPSAASAGSMSSAT